MMDAHERELFATTVRSATESTSGTDLDSALEAIGWREALADDPRAAVSELFEGQGAAGATSAALGIVAADAIGADLAQGAAFLLPAVCSTTAPGVPDDPGVAIPAIAVTGIGLADMRRCDEVVVATEPDGAPFTTTLRSSDLDMREVQGLDPSLGLVEVGTWTAASGSVEPLTPVMATTAAWPEAVAAAQRALAHEMVGAMRTMLAMAVEHALGRVQFGRPIAGFQAVRHRLAESLVAIEATAAALEGAWTDGSPLAAALAKAVAGDSARTVRRHCQQVLAGIGFTTEHDLHRFVRRTMVLDALFGDARSITEQIGASLVEQRRLPDILPL